MFLCNRWQGLFCLTKLKLPSMPIQQLPFSLCPIRALFFMNLRYCEDQGWRSRAAAGKEGKDSGGAKKKCRFTLQSVYWAHHFYAELSNLIPVINISTDFMNFPFLIFPSRPILLTFKNPISYVGGRICSVICARQLWFFFKLKSYI